MRRIAVVFFMLLIVGVIRAQQAPLTPTLVQPNREPHATVEQPVRFSHKIHVARGLQCQTCHANPEPGAQMTFPPTSRCMGCHQTVARDRPDVIRLTEFAKSNPTIPWVRVYTVLPGITWTHRSHVRAGVDCQTCHGAVGELDVMSEVTAVTGMASCVSCHQDRKASTACTVCHAWPAS